MSATTTTGVEAVKTDPLAESLPGNIPRQQSLTLRYKIKDRNELHQIQRVPGGNIEIHYPVENADVLSGLRFIESQFAAHNAVSDRDDDHVDIALCRAMPDCLTEENVTLPDDPISAARVRALIFKQARGIQSTTDLLEYLSTNPITAQELGFNTAGSELDISESTFSRERQAFKIDRQPVQDAICRLQHILFRNGFLLDALADHGYVADQPIPPDSQLPEDLRTQALVNWSELLLTRLLEGVSFNRASNRKYSPREIIAILANMALHDEFSKGSRLAQWFYQSDIASSQRIRQIIDEQFGSEAKTETEDISSTKEDIEDHFRALNQNLFQFAADEVGFFQRPLDIPVDATWIPIKRGIPKATPGGMGTPTISGDVEGGFCFATAVSVTPMARFSLGVKLVRDKSNYPENFRSLLTGITEFADIGWIYADREFDSRAMVDLCRSMAEKKWIIRVRENEKVIDDMTEQELRKKGKTQISLGGTDVNVFSLDFTPNTYFLKPRRQDDNMVLLSDMSREETLSSDLFSKYLDRWGIETFIREMKYDLTPYTQREDALEHLFLLSLASVFYNIYKIIGQSLSPLYGLPLRPTHYEVLQALVESTFPRQQNYNSHL